EGAIQKKSHRQIEDYLRRAKESLARQRRRTVLEKARENIARLHAMIAQAKAIRADFGDIEDLVAKAEQAFQQEDLRSLEALIERADATAKARVEQILKDRYPRLPWTTGRTRRRTPRSSASRSRAATRSRTRSSSIRRARSSSTRAAASSRRRKRRRPRTSKIR